LDYQVSQSNDIVTDHKSVQIILDWFEWKQSYAKYSPIQFDIQKASPETIKEFTQEVEIKCLSSQCSWEEFNIILKSCLANIIKSNEPTKRLGPIPPHIASLNSTIKNIKVSL